MNDPKLKQQIADKIKDASNILVTVSKDPSVDELSAALGFTLLLNKLDKHATAIFSGKVPPAITFLDPEKTFENTTDSLRDFIIALDKEKADHLRYKLEGDLVKIYITPYKTKISSEDLEFSQGDYNVELVIALGVENKDDLDAALDGHGKILHDATVVTLTAGEQVSNLGSIDWHDSNASSLCEMIASLQETMKLDKEMLDQSIATALLTGIVAATERFSNPRTTSRVMTLAADLMAAGADQQLIASRLEEGADAEDEADESDETVLEEGEKTKLPKNDDEAAKPPRPKGELVISHEKEGTIEQVAQEVGSERLEASARAAERALEKQEETAAMASAVTPAVEPQAPAAPRGAVSYAPPEADSAEAPAEPTFGGTLNATSEQAADDKRREIDNDKNKVILSHNYISGNEQPTFDAKINGVAAEEPEPTADIFAAGSSSTDAFEPPSAPTVTAHAVVPPSEVGVSSQFTESSFSAPSEPQFAPEPAATTPTLADIDAENRMPHDEARAAIDAAFAASPAPAPAPVIPEAVAGPADFGMPLPPPPPLPTDFSGGLPPLPPAPDMSQPGILGDILTGPAAPVAPQPAPFEAPMAPQPTDPAQFRIPGQ